MCLFRDASSALILLVVLLGVSLQLQLQLAASSPITGQRGGLSDSLAPPPPGLRGQRKVAYQRTQPLVEGEEEEEEEEDELFKDVDPKTLAAVLLEAMNKPQGARRAGEGDGTRGEEEEEKGEEVRAAEGADRDRDRDGREELELMMAAAAVQGREEQEREEEEERKKAQEEEERLTEKTTSRTTSQMVPVKEPGAGGTQGEVLEKEVAAREEAQQGPATQEEVQQQEEEEEQLSPEEVKNLQAMLEELQSYNTANKREREAQGQRERDAQGQREREAQGQRERDAQGQREREAQGQRESRGYSKDLDQRLIDNEIKLKNKGYPLAMLKKKLKWQEETQKAINRPIYRGGNFMDDFNDNLARPAEDEEEVENEGEEEGEGEEEVLSPEEEEAQAKEEQEEVRRQAAEAQRAKVEEEKLADIASDMLLQYMVKQDGRKYQGQNRKSSLSNNAAEDKRSDEEEEGEDDDIDPQTIDKLIEISSKLHLPADDVVDIISDVEKKKKKDVPETLPWQRPLLPPSAPAQALDPRNPTPKQPPAAINPLKAWFKDNSALAVKPSKQDIWIKPQKPFRTSVGAYPSFPFYQKPYRGYYPVYFPPPKPKPRYYAKPTLSLNDLLGNSMDYDFEYPPKRRFRPWVQPRPRQPPALRRNNLYFSSYLLPQHPRTFSPVPMPKPWSSPPRVQPRRRPAFYYPPPAPLVTREEDYYPRGPVGPQQDSNEDLEKYIQQVFMKHPRMYQ